MEMIGRVFSIEPDQRDENRAVVRIEFDGVVNRSAISMTYKDAGRFRINQGVMLKLVPLESELDPEEDEHKYNREEYNR